MKNLTTNLVNEIIPSLGISLFDTEKELLKKRFETILNGYIKDSLSGKQNKEIAKKFIDYCYLNDEDKPYISDKAIPLIFNECLKLL